MSSARILPLPIVTAAGLFVIFVLIEAFVAKEPVIPVAVLKSRGVLLTSLSTLCLMMARWLVLFYTPIYALAVRSWTPATAGTLLIPTNAGFGVGGLLVGLFHINRAGSFYR